MKLRDNSFSLAIITFPFLLLLSILKIKNVLKNDLYGYLILFMSIVFVIAFIFSVFFALDEILNSKNKKRVILLILCPIIYLPIYYTKYIYSNERVFGYITSMMNVMLLVGLFFSVKTFVNNYMINLNRKNFVLVSSYNYVDKNNNFTILVDNNYTCNNSLGDYVISCDNKTDDSFLGIYNYNKKNYSQGELDDILDFHISEIEKVIKEKGYTAEIEEVDDFIKISYNNMTVLINLMKYQKDGNTYCLIIIEEISNNNLNYFNFEQKIKNIRFLV